MARPLRIEYPGAIYHITSRGNARQPIYKDDKDRETFLELLRSVVKRYRWLCHAYCLMGNHYHLLLELCRYVVLNPVRAGVVGCPGRYKWSSYRATAGIVRSPSFLTTDWVLSEFGRIRRKAQDRYKEFVKEGIKKPSPWENLRGQILLGDDKFVVRLEPYLKDVQEVREVPRVQRLVNRPLLEELFRDIKGKSKSIRDKMIREVHLSYGYMLVEIARVAGLHYTTVSRIVNQK